MTPRIDQTLLCFGELLSSFKDVKKRERLGGAGTNGCAFAIENTKCWAGMYYAKPHVKHFEAYDVTKPVAEKLGIGRVAPSAKGVFKWITELDLESEAVHFFALSDNQQRRMEEFVREGVSAVKKMLQTAVS